MTQKFRAWTVQASLLLSLAVFLCCSSALLAEVKQEKLSKEDVEKIKKDAKVEQLQFKQEQRDDLSCSKLARRVYKIEDKAERRKFIAECRAKREARQRAELEKKADEKKAKKEAEEALLRGQF